MKYDYERIFKEKNEKNSDWYNPKKKSRSEISEIKKNKDRKYIIKFFVQSIICLVIIGSIIIVKYASPKTFISVSSILNGLYKDNITLSDLNELIDDTILKNDALAAFFNIGADK